MTDERKDDDLTPEQQAAYDAMTPEQQAAVDEMRDAWADFAGSVSCDPVLYDINEDTGERKLVWKGKPVTMADLDPNETMTQRVNKIQDAKVAEYERIGTKAFEDSEPFTEADLRIAAGEQGVFSPPLN